MKYITKLKLAAVHQICDVYDKSTEFTLQYMQDTCKVSLNTVTSYMLLPPHEHKQLFNDVNNLVGMLAIIEMTGGLHFKK